MNAGLDQLDFSLALRASALGRCNTFDSLGDRFLTGDVDNPAFALRLPNLGED